MKRFLTFLKVEGKLSLRSPDGIIFGIGMPVGVLLLIAVVAGSQSAGGADYSFCLLYTSCRFRKRNESINRIRYFLICF